MRRLVLLLLTFALLPFAAAAQDDDKGYLTRLIESSLSSDDQKVSLDGFQGALSSTASFDRLTISDAQGVWLTIENAKLNWSRSALLRGQLQVNELSASLIDLERLPPSKGSGELTLPSPTSAIIKIPDLPVEVHIGKIAADALRLGPTVLGQEIQATLAGSLDVAGGAGAVDIALKRTDGTEGRLTLDAAFDNTTRNLRIALDLAEAPDGVLASLLQLPDRPALEFTIAGDAPVSDFTADIRLVTAGSPRLTGTLKFSDLPDSAGLHYALDLSGNVASLFAEPYRRFFGSSAKLSLAGSRLTDGRTTIDALALQSQEVNLTGSLEIASDGLPQKFNLSGSLEPADGKAVLLPLPGPDTRIIGATVSAAYDAAKGDGFEGRIAFTGYEREGVAIAKGTLSATGTISRSGKRVVKAQVQTEVAGLQLPTPDLARAVGDSLTAELGIGWTEGAPIELTGMDLTAGSAHVTGDASLSGLDSNLRITAKVNLTAADLAPYSGLAGQSLAGAADAAIDGWFEPLGGAFDVTLDAATTGFDIGAGTIGDLVRGDGSFKGRLARGPEGTSFDNLRVETPQVSALLSGTLGAADGQVTLDARLADVAVVYPGLSGPVTAKGTLGRSGDTLTFDLVGQGPQAIALTAKGTALVDFSKLDVTVDGNIQDISVLVPQFTGPVAAKGKVALDGKALTLDLSTDGPEGANLQVTGGYALDTALADLTVTGAADLALANRFAEGQAVLTGQAQLDLKIAGPATLGSISGTVSARNARIELPAQAITVPDADLVISLDPRHPEQPEALVATRVQANVQSVEAPGQVWAPLLDGPVVLDAALALLPGGRATLRDLRVQNGDAQITGQADLAGLGAGISVTASLRTELGDLKRLEPLAGLALAGKAVATTDLGYDLTSRVLTADVKATTQGLSVGSGPVFDLIAGDTALAGKIRLDGSALDITGLELTNATATIRGTLGLNGLGGSLTVSPDLDVTVADLSRLSGLAGLPLSGAADLSVTGLYGVGDKTLDAQVVGTASGLKLGSGPVHALIAPDAALSARVQMQGDHLRLSDLELMNGDVSLKGAVDLAGLGGDLVISTDAQVSLASLSRLRPLVGLPLTGGVTADVTGRYVVATKAISGTIDGTATALNAGSGPAFALLAGDARFSAKVQGQGSQYTVTDASFVNSALNVTADYNPDRIDLNATLDNLGRFVPQLPGPVRIVGSVGLGDAYDVNATADGPGGVALTVKGTVSKALVPNLSINGTAPLGIANAFLPPTVDVQGNVGLDLSLSGELGLGGLGGTVTVSNGRASVPVADLALTGLEARISLSGGNAQIDASTGFSEGGKATLSGTIGLTGGNPVNLALQLVDVGVVKEPTLRTTLNGSLDLSGSRASGGRLSGVINLGETDINLAFNGGGGALISVDHVGESAAVDATLRRAGVIEDAATQSAGGTALGGRLELDLAVSAPNRVFIRGRGLDAELGGTLRLTGHAGAVVPIGQFDLIRGRLDILGKRLDLSEGSVSLQGSFDPVVRLVATTTTDDVNIQIVTEGTASAPRVSLQSSPDLPSDEVLALLLFGKGIDKISALQALQLANAVGTLIGSGGEGLQGKIRKQFGLDDLDVTTDANGSVALKAGKYLSENVYTDVTVNADGEAEIQLNLDVTPNLTARGKVGTAGDTSLGIFYEKDY